MAEDELEDDETDEEPATEWTLLLPVSNENANRLAELLIIPLRLASGTDYNERTGILKVYVSHDSAVPDFLLRFARTSTGKKVTDILDEMTSKTGIIDEITGLIRGS